MSSLLDRVAIASPCAMDWHAMPGDDRRRFCNRCQLHVHDLSAMTAAEAEALLRAAGQGRLCVRLHRRADGKVMTQDCPVGRRRRWRRAFARAIAFVVAFGSGLAACARSSSPARDRARMGDVALPALPPPHLGDVQLHDSGAGK